MPAKQRNAAAGSDKMNMFVPLTRFRQLDASFLLDLTQHITINIDVFIHNIILVERTGRKIDAPAAAVKAAMRPAMSLLSFDTMTPTPKMCHGLLPVALTFQCIIVAKRSAMISRLECLIYHIGPLRHEEWPVEQRRIGIGLISPTGRDFGIMAQLVAQWRAVDPHNRALERDYGFLGDVLHRLYHVQ